MIPKSWFGQEVLVVVFLPRKRGEDDWTEEGTLREAGRQGVVIEDTDGAGFTFVPWHAIAKICTLDKSATMLEDFPAQ